MTACQQAVLPAPGAAPLTTRPVRVGVVVTRLEGGAGVLALRGARVLDPGSCQATIITGGGSGRLLDAAAAAGIEVLVEPALRAPIAPRDDLVALRRLEALFRGRGFDVVHTHCAKAGALGRIAASRAAVPRIVHTYHGFPFHDFQSAPRRRAYVSIERRLGRITDVALCVGAGVAAEAIRRKLIAPERARTIGVAVDEAAGAAETAGPGGTGDPVRARLRARAALGLPAGATVVGAVGRLTFQKAPEDFVLAMRQVGRPGAIGVWIGGGELAGRMSQLASSTGGTGGMGRAGGPGGADGIGGPGGVSIRLPGERADACEVMSAFDVFVLPSRYEGLPTVIVEAMSRGVPVVATAVNAVPDLVIPGETGLLVPPRQPAQLAAAIRYLLDRPALAGQMAERARRRIAGRYGAGELRDSLMAAYMAEPPELLSTRATHGNPGDDKPDSYDARMISNPSAVAPMNTTASHRSRRTDKKRSAGITYLFT